MDHSAQRILWPALGLLLLLFQPAHAGFTIFSQGLVVPETISPVPAGFDSYGGQFFVLDYGGSDQGGKIMAVPATGGPATLFKSTAGLDPGHTDFGFGGGMFLPPDYGSQGGKYVAVAGGGIVSFAPDGTASVFANTTSSGILYLTTPTMAPAGFGTVGGEILVTAQSDSSTPNGGSVVGFAPDGTFSAFVKTPGFNPFGLAFAPAEFGSVAGKLLVSDISSGRIFSVDADGNVSPFAEIPLPQGDVGLRQMAFSPPGFGEFGNLLFVSISGSQSGGGVLGRIDVLDASGFLVATVKEGSDVQKFDPRGLLFLDGGNLLVSDASDPIILLTPANFQPVSEPETFALLASGVLFLIGYRRRVGFSL